jgi:putative ABC transport system permease protein
LESTVQVLRRLEGEIILVSRAKYFLGAGERFELRRLAEAREVPGVAGAVPIYLEQSRSILRPLDERGFPIRVIAFHKEDRAFAAAEAAAHEAELAGDQTALADDTSRRKYRFPRPPQSPADYAGELNGKRLRLVGRFHLGVDFATDGNLLMTAHNFARFFPHRAGELRDPLNLVDLGVVRVEPSANVADVVDALRGALPDDVEPWTKDRLIEREMHFWRTNAPLGYIFMVGATMGFIVGVVICYQIVYADIADHMRELATLKAIGYSNHFFLSLVLRQSFYLALLGFAPGLAISAASYWALARITGLTMQMTPGLATTVFIATAAMCGLSGLLAVNKLRAADPADLF